MLHGAETVARQTLAIASIAAPKHLVLVNGAAGVVITLSGQPIVPERIRRLDLSVLGY